MVPSPGKHSRTVKGGGGGSSRLGGDGGGDDFGGSTKVVVFRFFFFGERSTGGRQSPSFFVPVSGILDEVTSSGRRLNR
jgi:hypothetical protein